MKCSSLLNMAESSIDTSYKCLLCIESLKRPKSLPCDHTYCENCLDAYIKGNVRTTEDGMTYFLCPVCDMRTAPKTSNKDPNTWASLFPVNTILIGLGVVDSLDDKHCDACTSDGDNNIAEYWCNDCAETLCKSCQSAHKRIKASRYHTVVSLADLGNDNGVKSITINEHCRKHEEEKLQVYCLDHNFLCCNLCVSLSHRSCQSVYPIKEMVSKSAQHRNMFESEWQQFEKEINKMINEKKDEMSNYKEMKQEKLATMTEIIQTAKQELDDLKLKVQSHLECKFEKMQEIVTAEIKHLREFHANAANSKILMSCFTNIGSDKQIFIAREHTKSQMEGHFCQLKQKLQNQPMDMSLKLDGKICKTLETIKSIGRINVPSRVPSSSHSAILTMEGMFNSLYTCFSCPKSSADPRCLPQEPNVSAQANEEADMWKEKLAVSRDSLKGVYQPWLTGGMFTDDGKLLLTDNHNKRVVLFNDKYEYVAEFKFEDPTTAITSGHAADEVFVATDKSAILRCTLKNDQLDIASSISSPHGTCGVALLGDKILVGTYDSVSMLSLDGEDINSTKKSGYFTYVVASKKQDTFYYNDGNEIICRRQNGEEVFRWCSNDDMKSPTGVCLDQDDNVYITGRDSGNVYVISRDGSKERLLLDNIPGISSPWGIVFHPHKQEFVVTSHAESIAFRVYELCASD